mgnify:CR=1 FL=1
MKWFSVKEKLPEKTEWVLVYADGAMACRAWNADKKQFEDWQMCQTPGVLMNAITHWMHLPPSPSNLTQRAADKCARCGTRVNVGNWPICDACHDDLY